MTLDALRKSDIILICGLPGSGKSHFARKYFKKSGRKRINRKEIRKHIYEMFNFNDGWTESCYHEEDELLVKYIEKKIIEHLVFNGEKVVIDNISVSEKSRIDYINLQKLLDTNDLLKSKYSYIVDTTEYDIKTPRVVRCIQETKEN